MDNEELTRLFSASGQRHGFTDVTAEYAPFRDFKIRWTRNYRWARFEVSDYMEDAPVNVMRPVADTVFKRICGDKAPYPQTMRDWMMSREFLDSKRPLYIRRFDGFVQDLHGKVKDLSGSLDRLNDAGLVPKDGSVVVGWSDPNVSKCVGTASIVMKTVSVSTTLDRDYVDDDLLDYCLYSLLARVSMGMNPTGDSRGEEYEALLDSSRTGAGWNPHSGC